MIPAEADVTVFVSDDAFNQYDIDVSNSIMEQSLTGGLISRDLLSTSGTIYQMILRSSSVGPVSSLLTCLLLAVAVSILVACGSESEDPADLVCSGLETVAERVGLITRGSMNHCILNPRDVTITVAHRTVDEVWYFL